MAGWVGGASQGLVGVAWRPRPAVGGEGALAGLEVWVRAAALSCSVVFLWRQVALEDPCR